jgi:hypothetical protein
LIRFAVLGLIFATMPHASGNEALSLKLTAAAATVKSGSAIWVTVTTTNESNRTLNYKNTNLCNYSFKAFTSLGEPAPATQPLELMDCEHVGDSTITGRDIPVTLKPGESSSEYLLLSNWIDMTQPGQYSVHVERTYRGIGHFTSNTITIEVTP